MRRRADKNGVVPNESHRWLNCAVLVMFPMLCVGCSPDRVSVKTAPELNATPIRTMAVVPFDALSTPQQTSFRSEVFLTPQLGPTGYHGSFEGSPQPISDRLTSRTMTVSADAAAKITRMVYDKLRRRSGIQVRSLEQTAQAKMALNPAATGMKPRELAKRIGSELSADAVLLGLVRVYREREGSKIAATPSEVGFGLQLLSTRDGAILWSGDYYEEQKPLIEDLAGFIERGGTFVTVEQLAEYGVERVMERFPLGQGVSKPGT